MGEDDINGVLLAGLKDLASLIKQHIVEIMPLNSETMVSAIGVTIDEFKSFQSTLLALAYFLKEKAKANIETGISNDEFLEWIACT